MNPVKNEELEIHSSEISKASYLFEAILHPLRQQLLHLLDKKGRLPLTAIQCKMQLEQAVCLQHLHVLCKAGLVSREKEGHVFYAINYERLYQLYACAEALLP